MMGGFSAVLLNDLFGGPDQGHASSLAVLVAMPVSNGIDISRFGRRLGGLPGLGLHCHISDHDVWPLHGIVESLDDLLVKQA